jgi:hypothetical protein
MGLEHLESRSERVVLQIPAHLRAAWHRRGSAWFIEQLTAVAAADIGHTLERFMAYRKHEKQEQKNG